MTVSERAYAELSAGPLHIELSASGASSVILRTVDGWYGTPQTKVQLSERTMGNGAYVPAEPILYAVRTVTLGVSANAQTSADVAAAMDSLSAFAGKMCRVVISDSGRPETEAHGYVEVAWDKGPYRAACDGTLTIVCPDPRRYGTTPHRAYLSPGASAGALAWHADAPHGLLWPLSYGGGGVQAADMPEYVKDAALEVARKVAAVQTSNTITFIAMSDAHDLLTNSDIRTGLMHAGMAAKAISYMVPLDFFFHGGDATMGSATTTLADGKAEMAEVNHWIDEAAESVPNFRTVGNHDALRYNTGITPLTDAELYEYFGRYNADGTTVMGSTTAGYCHRDLTAKRVRIICLNTAESGKENVSAAQQLWFCRTLAAVPSGYGVVILSHHPLDWGAINPCANILYQFHEKGSYTVSGTTVSFASVNPAYTVCFHGHVHDFLADRVNRVVNSQGVPFDVQRIAVPNVCFNRNNEYWQNGAPEYYGIEYGQPTTYNKTAGTANDTAFVVNVIDPDNEIVHSFCYGAGVDRAVGIGATVYHMVSLSLTHVTSSNASTAAEDSTAYTTTLTADSGYDMQAVTVTMGGTDITSTAYNSSTGVVSIASVTGAVTITATAIVHTSYTNLVPTAVDSSGNVVGYKDGYYVSGSGKVGAFSALSGFTATGAMALPSGWQHIYVKGVPMLSGDSHERYYFGKADKTVPDNGGYINATNYASARMTIETLDTNYYRISSTNTNTLAAAWVCMSFKTSTGANLVVTVDEPIE